MKAHNDWYDSIGKEISFHKVALSEKDYKKYKLDLLLRMAKRVADFSPECGECQTFQPEITKLTQDVSNLSLMSKESRKSYFKTISKITKHLQKHHKLVTGGQYLGIGMVIGAGIGIALGASLENSGVGVALGITIGVAVGSALDAKAKKQGRVI